METKFENIVAALQGKAVLKQHILQSTLGVFSILKAMAADIAKRLSGQFEKQEVVVPVDYLEEGDFEFQLRFGTDVLMFSMQTNVQTFMPGHILSQSPYVLENDVRGFYGTITIYNFMADSVKFNRLDDAGYLLARMMINCEGHFYIEGLRDLYFSHPDISTNVIDEGILRTFIESAMLIAIEQDLYAPAYQDVQFIALGAKLQDQMAGAAKVGFQMKAKV